MATELVDIQIRRGTAAQWAATARILLAGEWGYDTTTPGVKIGDGSTAWASLPFIGGVTTAQVQSTVAAMLTGGTRSGITVTYDSTAKTFDFTVQRVLEPLVFSQPVVSAGFSGSDEAEQSQNLTGAKLRVNTAPVGASLVVNVQSNQSGTFTTIGTLTLPAGSTTEQTITFTHSQSAGALTRVQAVPGGGTTTAAEGLVVDVTRALP